MIQRFIELGEGYSDLYELFEIARTNKHRLARLLQFETTKQGKQYASFVVVLQPTTTGNFQPLYICREGITILPHKKSKRIELFEQLAKELETEIIPFQLKPSNEFAEITLFYQYVIGILRMNRIIAPLQ